MQNGERERERNRKIKKRERERESGWGIENKHVGAALLQKLFLSLAAQKVWGTENNFSELQTFFFWAICRSNVWETKKIYPEPKLPSHAKTM